MTATSPATSFVSGFAPLAPLLQAIKPETLDAARLRVVALDRDALVNGFRSAFASDKRILAFVLSEELTKRGIPPGFRLHHLSATDYSINQKFDLMLYDLRWLRHAYPDHRQAVRYKRCKVLFAGADRLFHNEAEFAFYGGNRASWQIVKSLSLTEEQQLDCCWLQSAPIVKRREAAQAMRAKVFKALQDDLQAVRRTKRFTDDDAKVTLFRRHRLWVCIGYTNGSPAAVAKKYAQLTGESITRQAVSRQLQIVGDTLRKTRMKGSKEIEVKEEIRSPLSE